MEFLKLFVYLAGILGIFVGAVKLEENVKLKKEIRMLRKKLGKEDTI